MDAEQVALGLDVLPPSVLGANQPLRVGARLLPGAVGGRLPERLDALIFAHLEPSDRLTLRAVAQGPRTLLDEAGEAMHRSLLGAIADVAEAQQFDAQDHARLNQTLLPHLRSRGPLFERCAEGVGPEVLSALRQRPAEMNHRSLQRFWALRGEALPSADAFRGATPAEKPALLCVLEPSEAMLDDVLALVRAPDANLAAAAREVLLELAGRDDVWPRLERFLNEGGEDDQRLALSVLRDAARRPDVQAALCPFLVAPHSADVRRSAGAALAGDPAALTPETLERLQGEGIDPLLRSTIVAAALLRNDRPPEPLAEWVDLLRGVPTAALGPLTHLPPACLEAPAVQALLGERLCLLPDTVDGILRALPLAAALSKLRHTAALQERWIAILERGLPYQRIMVLHALSGKDHDPRLDNVLAQYLTGPDPGLRALAEVVALRCSANERFLRWTVERLRQLAPAAPHTDAYDWRCEALSRLAPFVARDDVWPHFLEAIQPEEPAALREPTLRALGLAPASPEVRAQLVDALATTEYSTFAAVSAALGPVISAPDVAPAFSAALDAWSERCRSRMTAFGAQIGRPPGPHDNGLRAALSVHEHILAQLALVRAEPSLHVSVFAEASDDLFPRLDSAHLLSAARENHGLRELLIAGAARGRRDYAAVLAQLCSPENALLGSLSPADRGSAS